MPFKINFKSELQKAIKTMGPFTVSEYIKDPSVSAWDATQEYFMSKMNVKKRQVIVALNGQNSVITQAGAMQWTAGNVECNTGVKGVGDLLGKMVKSSVTKESAVKPQYYGCGTLTLEPTYKHILLVDVAQWGPAGITLEDGMFLACEGTLKQNIVARSNFSSAMAGGEGLFNLSLVGNGVAALESPVPEEELIEIELNNDTLKVDGNLAVCWSSTLQFTVERSSKSLIGSAVNGEGFVNVYRGTGKVWLCPTTRTNHIPVTSNID